MNNKPPKHAIPRPFNATKLFVSISLDACSQESTFVGGFNNTLKIVESIKNVPKDSPSVLYNVFGFIKTYLQFEYEALS